MERSAIFLGSRRNQDSAPGSMQPLVVCFILGALPLRSEPGRPRAWPTVRMPRLPRASMPRNEQFVAYWERQRCHRVTVAPAVAAGTARTSVRAVRDAITRLRETPRRANHTGIAIWGTLAVGGACSALSCVGFAASAGLTALELSVRSGKQLSAQLAAGLSHAAVMSSAGALNLAGLEVITPSPTAGRTGGAHYFTDADEAAADAEPKVNRSAVQRQLVPRDEA